MNPSKIPTKNRKINPQHKSILNDLIDLYNNKKIITFKDNVLPLILEKYPYEDRIYDTEFEAVFTLYINCFSSLFIDSSYIFPYGVQTASCCYYSLSVVIDLSPEKEYIISQMQKFVKKHAEPGSKLLKFIRNKSLITDPMFIRKIIHLALLVAPDDIREHVYKDIHRIFTSMVEEHKKNEIKQMKAHSPMFENAYRLFSRLVYNDPNNTFTSIEQLFNADEKKIFKFIWNKLIYHDFVDYLGSAESSRGCYMWHMWVFSWLLDGYPIIELRTLSSAFVNGAYPKLKNYRPYTLYYAEHVNSLYSCDFKNLKHEPLIVAYTAYPDHEIPVIPIWQLKGKWDAKWLNKQDYIEHLSRFFDHKTDIKKLLDLIDNYGGYQPDTACIIFEELPLYDQ